MDKRLKLIVTVFLLLTTLTGVAVVRSGKEQKAIPSFAAPSKLPAASRTTKPNPSPSVTSVNSPDGKMTLNMDTKRGSDGSVTWTFSVAGNQIFTEILPGDASFTIPFNTFSPDNKYIFLQKKISGAVTYPVLSTSGSSISKDGQGLEIVSLFSEKFPDYKVTDVTGWGGINLIVFNTDKTAGGTGPSFWFEVPTKSFIRLSNRFE